MYTPSNRPDPAVIKPLTDWIKIVEDQNTVISDRYKLLSAEDQRLAGSRTASALAAEAYLCGVGIDAAVRDFVRTGSWPLMNADCLYYLLHRLQLARRALRHLLRQEATLALHTACLHPPHVHDREAFIRWLLIDVWNDAGERYLSSRPAIANNPSDASADT